MILPLSLVDSDRIMLFTQSLGVSTLVMTPYFSTLSIYCLWSSPSWTDTGRGGWTIGSAPGSRVTSYDFIWNSPNLQNDLGSQ